MVSTEEKIGVLGGGQLGRMLCLAAANWDLKLYILDKAPHYPAASLAAGFTAGDFNSFEDVIAFGADKSILTVEIEHVNTAALQALADAGKIVHPSPKALEIIQDKGRQKEFFRQHQLPTAEFEVFESEQEAVAAIQAGRWHLPCVQKTRRAGYDGRGVTILRTEADLENKLLKGPCILEKLVEVQTELAVVAARNASGEIAVYPPVEMEFHPEANLVEMLLCPARVSPLIAAAAEALAEKVIETFDVCGLLAVEMFLTTKNHILINEVAPRPHNSAHHTINSAETSQFEQHLRAICNLPLGATRQLRPAVMVNLLGEPGYKGPVRYEGLAECLAMEGVHLHLYGKADTAPFRKMGHATVTASSLHEAVETARKIQKTFKVLATDV